MKNLGYTNHSDHAADAMRYAFLHLPQKRRAKSQRTRNIVLFILLVLFLAVMWFVTKPANDAYNKHMCAVYGYEEDCKTPLPPERRLK